MDGPNFKIERIFFSIADQCGPYLCVIKYGYLGPCFYVHVIQKVESALAITQEVELLRTNVPRKGPCEDR